jgi:hypothetical protein
MRTERGKGNAGRKLVWGTLAGLFLAGLVSLALGIRTNEVELGRDSVYDGTVKIARNEGGALVFQDNELTSPVKLSTLGGSATQHGTLTGLSADDHPQYLNPARHLSGHHAAYNAALPVPPDIHGNATLGAHVSDPDIHPNRAQNAEITGNWRFCGAPDVWNGIRFSHGGVAGDIALDFEPGESPAQILWSQPENRFRLNRGLLVNGQVTLPPMNSAGFVKNGADGLLSGGNTVHLDSADVTGVLPASHVAADLTVSSSGLVDAGAVKSGTLSNDRFSAFSDLWSENKVGSSDEQVARGNHVHNQYPTDYVDKWLVTSQTMQGTLVLPSLNVGGATNAGDGEIKIQDAQNAPRVTTVYMAPQSQTQGPHLVSKVFVSDHWYDRDNILYDDDADAATYTTGAWPREHLYVYDAGFTDLNGVTFTGIEVTFRAKSDRAGDADALFVNCVHGSQKLGNTKEKTLGTSFATDTMGGPSDMWGMTQEEAQLYIPINASFGLELDSSLYASGDKVWVDWIKIKVYYTQNSAARAWSAGSRTVEGDYAIAQNGDLSTSVALRLSQTTRLPQFPAMTTQGFLKNDASGNVTGGNNAALADGSVLTTQHYHSALAASDGSPNPAVTVDTGGNIGIGCTPSSKLSIGSTDGTQQVGAYHDNSNAYFNTSKGSIIYTTTEGTNTPLSVYWKGKGTGHSEFRLYDVGAQTNCLIIGCYGGYGSLYGTGAGLQPLRIMETADTGVSFFTSAASGETPAVTISGYRAADAKRTLSVAVGSEANDTASFTGLTNYKFTGSINATANLQTGGTTRIDSAGAATLGNITSSAYNVPRGRGIGTTLPSTDLRDWDMFFRSDINTLYIYVSGSWRAAAPLP